MILYGRCPSVIYLLLSDVHPDNARRYLTRIFNRAKCIGSQPRFLGLDYPTANARLLE